MNPPSLNPYTPEQVLHAIATNTMAGTYNKLAEIGDLIAITPNPGDHPTAYTILNITHHDTETHNQTTLHLQQHTNPEIEIHRGWKTPTHQLIDPWIKALTPHHPTCNQCGHLIPCPHMAQEAHIQQELQEYEQYSNPHLCPACQQPTHGQPTTTITHNKHGLHPLNYHQNPQCLQHAHHYEQQLLDQNPNYQPQTHCPGHQYTHNGHTYCQNPHCKGPNQHHKYTTPTTNLKDIPNHYTQVS